MDFMSLPLEIIRHILREAAEARGFKRALRLRLVCTTFAAEIPIAIVESNVLATHCQEPYLRTSCYHDLHQRYHLPYFRSLALSIRPEAAPIKIKAIIETAALLRARPDTPRLSHRDYVKELCSLPMFPCPGKYFSPRQPNTESYDIEIAAFVAAAHMNLMSVVLDMGDSMFERHGYHFWSNVFSTPYRAAARQGHVKVLVYLLNKLLEHAKRNSEYPISFETTRALCLRCASQCGHLSVIEMLLSDLWPPLKAFTRANGTTEKYLRNGYDNALAGSRTCEILSKLWEMRKSTGLTPEPIPCSVFRPLFCRIIRENDVKSLKFLFTEIWPESRVPMLLHSSILQMACWSGGPEVVQCFLDYAASQGKYKDLVCHAATAGNLAVVKLLVEQGYDANEVGRDETGLLLRPAIVSAIEFEHIGLFRFLLSKGAEFSRPQIYREAVRSAQLAGLGSMLELLEREGIDINDFDSSPRERRWGRRRFCDSGPDGLHTQVQFGCR